MSGKTKLELTWIGKENRPKLEPRILIEESEKSYCAQVRHSADNFDNKLIFGDNLLALKALEPEHSNSIKCVYIDPPFNTGQAFEHYDDGIEHSIWLSLIRERSQIIHRLLSPEGTLFVHIDDNELGYLVVLLDEIFGRSNRISITTFKQGAATGHKAINPGIVSTSNFIAIYAKDKQRWKPNKIYTGRNERDKRYGQFIVNRKEHYSQWQFMPLAKAFANSLKISDKQVKKELGSDYENKLSDFVYRNSDSVVRLARPDYKSVSASARATIDESIRSKGEILLLQRDDNSDMYFVGGERILFYSSKLKLIDGELVSGEPLTSIWDDLLSNNLHNEGGVDFPKSKKPEGLIKRCIELSTNPGDLVLDSFLGSGTTAAVAHKMGRRWIGIELGEHCHTHCIPRLKKVINGEDPGGITEAVGWKGGGGFRYYRLAPSLLEQDKWGNWVISKEYNAAMLAEALCKLEGFRYEPSPSVYWMHGRSSEQDFLYATTQNLSPDQLQALSDEVGPGRSLLVLCAAYRGDGDKYPNLTLKKIPKTVLAKCEWGHDDYSLKIENLPKAPESQTPAPVNAGRKPKAKAKSSEPDLFGEEP